MSLVSLKCKNCGSGVAYNDDAQMVTCNHCGSTFMLSELLDEKDLNFIKANKEIDVEKKMEVGKLLKQAETLIYQAEYRQAEEVYKKVIELDEKNYKGYYGVVKAKTHNFNKVPENEDYAEYAKIALKYVDVDEKNLIKSEFEKLELITAEQKIRQRELLSAEKQKRVNEEMKRTNDKFFSKITYILILLITAVIIVFLVATGTKPNGGNNTPPKTYEVSTASGLISALTESNGLASTIIIKNDIDFEGSNWTPIGTKQKPFTGKIYGNDFTLSNLNIVVSTDEGEIYAGLFGYIKNASIFKLKLDNVDISSSKELAYKTNHNIGFICGYAENSTIKLCEIADNCNLTLTHSKQSTFSIGGIAGSVINSTISSSGSNAKITATCQSAELSNGNLNYYIGGVVGYFNSSNIIYCHSKSEIACSISSINEQEVQTFVGGIIGYNIATNPTGKYIKNCYFAGKLNSNTTSTNKNQYIAGIVAYGANQASLQNNIVLNLDSFVLNNSAADISTFFDYSSNESVCTYFADENEFNIKLEIIINSVA